MPLSCSYSQTFVLQTFPTVPCFKNVVGKTNLWSLIAKAHDGSPIDLDFDTMEGLFCQQNSLNGQQSPRLGGNKDRSSSDSLDRKKRESVEINLLDGKRSLNVNIFLKQFRSSNDDIIRILREGTHEDIGAEKLRGLLKILPESDEVELLRNFSGDRQKLGIAEKFLLQLVELPNYKLRCESMLLKEEFGSNMAFLEPAVESIVSAAHELKYCPELHEVLYMLLVAGNFLNSGGYAGDAAGFKIMSLLKITDTRANKPGMNFIHYMAQEIEKFPNLLKFYEQLPSLEDAARLSIDNLKTEIANLSQKVMKISQQVSNAGEDIRYQMEDFLKLAAAETRAVQKEIEELEKVRIEMAEFLCEDLHTFKLEECFKVFHGFCTKFKAAIEENENRRQQEKRAEARRRQREEQLSTKKKHQGENRPSSYSGSESDHIIDMLLNDIKGGFPHNRVGDFSLNKSQRKTGQKKPQESPGELSRMNSLTSSLPSEEEVSTSSPRVLRRRIGSLSSVVTNGESGDVESPDATPNGTLRRRRTRMPSDDHEDSSLMDYLRQAADLELSPKLNGEKSIKGLGSDTGSLDRSSLRKSRRRRADVLASELNERERPASPLASPVVERKMGLPDGETHKPRQWRKKIEDWLSENEKEQQREKRLRDKINLEKWKRQEQEQRESDLAVVSNVETRLDDNSKNLTKNLETLHEAKTDSELYSNKLKDPSATSNTQNVTTTTEGPQLKDKSKWRKSNLNVANSSESIDDERRRNRSRKSLVDLDSGPDDTITLYLRASEENNRGQARRQSPGRMIVDKKTNMDSPSNYHQNKISDESKCNEVAAIKSNNKEDMKIDPFKQLADTKMAEDQNFPSDAKNSVANLNTPVQLERNRLYHSMKEPSFHRVEEELKKAVQSDDELAIDGKHHHQIQRDTKIDVYDKEMQMQPGKAAVADNEDDQGSFDRFSFMRKTTRRTKLKHKSQESDKAHPDTVTGDLQSNSKAPDPVKNPMNETVISAAMNEIEGAINDIGKASQEIQNLTETSKPTYSVSSTKFPATEMVEDVKKKDKSTSLKARLSKRLLSLTDNLKGKHSESSEKSNIEMLSKTADVTNVNLPCTEMRDTQFSPKNKSLNAATAGCEQSLKHSEIHPVTQCSDSITFGSKNSPQPIQAKKSLDPLNFQSTAVNKLATVESGPGSPASPVSAKSYNYVKKHKNDHPEKDEGFEETQSQLSEVTSQGAFSSYDTDSVDSPGSSRQVKSEIQQSDIVPNEHATDYTIARSPKQKLKHDDSQIAVPNFIPVGKLPAKQTHPPRPTNLGSPIAKRGTNISPLNKTVEKRNIRSQNLPPQSKIERTESPKKTTTTQLVKPRSSIRPIASPSSKMFKSQTKEFPKSNLKNSGNSFPNEKYPKSKGSTERLRNPKNFNEPIGKRMAAYTKAIRTMTSNLNRSTRGTESYDVTQSMPPTPSEENKSLVSVLTENGGIRNSRRVKSSSSVNVTKPLQKEISLSGSSLCSRPGSQKTSEKSLDRLSRKSSDKSLNLSRRSSETSVVTVKSASRKNGTILNSPDGRKSTNIKNQGKNLRTSTLPKSIPSSVTSPMTARRIRNNNMTNQKTNRIHSKEQSLSPTTPSSPVKPRLAVTRSSSDGSSCSFMKATSASSAKISGQTKVSEPKNRTKSPPMIKPSKVLTNKVNQR